jgi:hypothetical protein
MLRATDDLAKAISKTQNGAVEIEPQAMKSTPKKPRLFCEVLLPRPISGEISV